MNALRARRFRATVLLAAALALFGLSIAAQAQTKDWAWVGGDLGGQLPVYGKQGVPSPSITPGSRVSPATWIDASGNLWLFGGQVDGYQYNDLWEMNGATLEWTWISGTDLADQPGSYGMVGVTAPGNLPGSRLGAVTWVDASGNLWLFGGEGANDLWEFSPATSEWTWMGGDKQGSCGPNGCPGSYGKESTASTSNLPSSRELGNSWIDASGNFWLFGGQGVDSAGKSGYLNDLWKYTPSTGAWTWVSGSDLANQTGNYGQLQTPASTNVPGARSNASSWIDAKNDLWLFGGSVWGGVDLALEPQFNDLWEFVPSTGEWTWMDGGDQSDQSGTFGLIGAASTSYIPTAREGAASWVDNSGNFWLFGGDLEEFGDVETITYFNDLWEFNSTTLDWTWVSGSVLPGCQELDPETSGCWQADVYGGFGVPARANVPGGRTQSIGWADKEGDFWLLGGAMPYTSGEFDDLWLYSMPLPAPTFSPGSGTYTTGQAVTIADSSPGTVIHYTTDGTAPTPSSPLYSGPITVGITGQTLQALAVVPNSLVTTPVASATYTFSPSSGPAVPSLSSRPRPAPTNPRRA